MLLQDMNGSAYSNGHPLKNGNGHMYGNGYATSPSPSPSPSPSSSPGVRGAELLDVFLKGETELQAFRSGKPVTLDGASLSIPAVVASGRYGAGVALDSSPAVISRVAASRKTIDDKLASATSIYGISTGFGGSADTRTDQYVTLGHALLQHHHSGVLSTSPSASVLSLGDPLATSSMPEAWVRAAIVVRANSLIRGHSGVRWEVMQQMVDLLAKNITPLVPLRGSISASGDLTPLAYVAGALTGSPNIRVHTDTKGGRTIMPAAAALAAHKLPALQLQPKEHLGLMNGTAFSAAVGALALHEAAHAMLLAQVCTALGTEALLGTQASHDPFIHDVCRPHPGQVECARNIFGLLDGSKLATTGGEEECSIRDDRGTLRQDRYPLRTAAQWLGPQIEDVLASYAAVTLECNSTTDNPLIDSTTGHVHHGGNFQAMAVTNAMEKTRLALHHAGKLLFAQCTELLNPAFNRGLPPSVAATDPSTNYHAKGLDVAVAAYMAELGFLANPVSTHVQSAEMHNQAVNSLALISARATLTALDVLSMLMASYLYVLCQALDLRALQKEFAETLPAIVTELTKEHLPGAAPHASAILSAVHEFLEVSSTQDTVPRMRGAARSAALPLYEAELPATAFRDALAARMAALYAELTRAYLEKEKSAAPLLGRTSGVYEFVRGQLGVGMHGLENLRAFEGGLGAGGARTIGENVSVIYEAIRDGRMQEVVVKLFT